MPRASVYIALFLISVNAAAGMLQVTGVAGDLGVGVQSSQQQELEQAQQEAQRFGPGGGAGQTLFGLYASLAKTVTGIVEAVSPAASMAINAGVPAFYANFVFAFLLVIPTLDVIAFLRSGGSLT